MEFVPTVGINVTGNLYMAFDYDAADHDINLTPVELSQMAGARQSYIAKPMRIHFNSRQRNEYLFTTFREKDNLP